MAHPQNSPRGLFAKNRIDVGSNQLTGNSTALILNAGIKVSNGLTVTANGSSLSSDLVALPGDLSTGNLAFGENSTGATFVAVRTTGTTWKYLNVTVDLPT